MYHYHAAQLKTDKKGDPTGPYYYVGHEPGEPAAGRHRLGHCHHRAGCDGHATPEDARAHYREYLLDGANFGAQTPGTYSPCEYPGCGVETDRQAQAGPGHSETHSLCDAHRNREGLDRVMGEVSDVVSGTPWATWNPVTGGWNPGTPPNMPY